MHQGPPSDPVGRAVLRQAAVVMDFHAHLSGAEVIGLLGGRWDAEARRLAVTHAFPCRPAQARAAAPAPPSVRASATRSPQRPICARWAYSPGDAVGQQTDTHRRSGTTETCFLKAEQRQHAPGSCRIRCSLTVYPPRHPDKEMRGGGCCECDKVRGGQGSESEVSVELDAADEVHKRATMADMGLVPAGWCPPPPPPPTCLRTLSGRLDAACTLLARSMASPPQVLLQRERRERLGSPCMPSCRTVCVEVLPWLSRRAGSWLQVPLSPGLRDPPQPERLREPAQLPGGPPPPERCCSASWRRTRRC